MHRPHRPWRSIGRPVPDRSQWPQSAPDHPSTLQRQGKSPRPERPRIVGRVDPNPTHLNPSDWAPRKSDSTTSQISINRAATRSSTAIPLARSTAGPRDPARRAIGRDRPSSHLGRPWGDSLWPPPGLMCAAVGDHRQVKSQVHREQPASDRPPAAVWTSPPNRGVLVKLLLKGSDDRWRRWSRSGGEAFGRDDLFWQ